MEGLEAVALAGNVIQFVEFAWNFVSRVHNIYTEASDESRNQVRLQNMLKDFILVAARLDTTAADDAGVPYRGIPVQAEGGKLQETMRILAAHSTVLDLYTPQDASPTGPEKVLVRSCKDIATKLLERLEKLRTAEERGKGRIWNSVKAALQEAWSGSDLDGLLKDLQQYQDQLKFHVLASVRESVELISHRQYDQFQKSSAVMNKLLEVMQSHQNAISRDHEMVDTIAEQHEITRREVKNAIIKTFGSLRLGESNEFDLELLAPAGVISKRAESYAEALLQEERAILNSLKFPVMLDREEDISVAEKRTFGWIFEDPKPDDLPWSNFRAWLRGDDPLYWITGKAGSGKSTLMKYIFCHPRTRREISLWATSAQPLIIAGFFFWNTGSPMQKTQQGLFRSLLYQILSNHRELIPLVRSEIGFDKSDDLSEIWTKSRLERVFRQLISQRVKAIKVFLFIDGLDEYAGSHADITKLLKDLSTAEGVRICVSSRPYIAFQNAFGKYPSLMLQNLTYRNIKTYVTTKFNRNAQMIEVQRQEPETAKLAREVVDKAAGVFLWVRLVVRSLLEGLGSFDRLSDLKRRLEELPEDLEDLYWHILQSVKPAFYLEQAAKLLLIAFHAGKPLTLLQLAYADLEDPAAAVKASFDAFTTEQQIEMANFMQGRMKTRCLDLLEVPASSSATDIRHKTVQFMHQSVADFLATAEVKARLKACLSKQPTFSPYACLMKASILEMKHLKTVLYPHSNNQPACYLADVWYTQAWRLIWQFIDYAKTMGQDEQEVLIELMNELDRTAKHVWHLYVQAECRFVLADGVHWSEMRFEGRNVYQVRKYGSIQAFALENGILSFVMATVKTMSKPQIKYALLVDEATHGPRLSSELEEVRSVLKESSKPRIRLGSETVSRLGQWARLTFESRWQWPRSEQLRHIRNAHVRNLRGKDEPIKKQAPKTNSYISRTVFGVGA
ncbi:Vegetative incompatibility protein HET-E-1 [Madurella mycetomatis]|uniref:Vegetative incompatibility protein HET-E-1 n=1 Tax=Madurella mycetomatis TaxID=100816 RepID=A0A175VPE6_9PEZI|nr:Vegetative incompatibility protein HET-E-1 [Madurella mycetomatis]KXX74469.1 Vegetative incompatibility protein HET-E-1 [Madurella mycetomatis]